MNKPILFFIVLAIATSSLLSRAVFAVEPAPTAGGDATMNEASLARAARSQHADAQAAQAAH